MANKIHYHILYFDVYYRDYDCYVNTLIIPILCRTYLKYFLIKHFTKLFYIYLHDIFMSSITVHLKRKCTKGYSLKYYIHETDIIKYKKLKAHL